MDWFEPRSFSEWMRRAFGLRPILLVLLVLGGVVTELRFDWIELALGAYLVKTNDGRPESGAIWEVGHRKMTAQRTLEKIFTDRMEIQREVREAATLLQIAERIGSDDGGIMLSPDHFRTLYLSIPPSFAREILPPLDLVQLIGRNEWDRTYVEKKNDGLIIYLLDRSNRVLRQLEVGAELLYQLKQRDVARSGALDIMPKFKNRIYPSDRFFSELAALEEDVRRSVVPQPENLLKADGKISRVGISDEAVAGFIEIGFEFETGGERTVILAQGHEWAVWMLRSKLEERGAPSPGSPAVLNSDRNR